jgi:hypothetical protein
MIKRRVGVFLSQSKLLARIDQSPLDFGCSCPFSPDSIVAGGDLCQSNFSVGLRIARLRL